MNNCTGAHVNYQPSDEEWVCPQCGSDSEHFVIDESDDNNDGDCVLLHGSDLLFCNECEAWLHGNEFSKICAEKVGMIPCSCCNGTGLVKKESN